MKKVFALIAALAFSALALAGCGSQQGASSGASSAASGAKTLKVGATAVPHAEILEAAKPLLEKEGITLEIVEFNDYVQPNLALNDKELDANFFQHEPYLKNFMDEHKEVKLKNAAGIHIEPMGVYSKKITKLDELKDGATIAIPNDPTNGGRSLLLLEKAGIIKLKEGVGEISHCILSKLGLSASYHQMLCIKSVKSSTGINVALSPKAAKCSLPHCIFSFSVFLRASASTLPLVSKTKYSFFSPFWSIITARSGL